MMRNFFIGLISAILLLALPSSSAWTQRGLPASMDEFYSFGDDYFLEAMALPGTIAGKSRLVVTFRITNDMMTFRKVTQAYQKQPVYIATPSMSVEAVDADGVIVARGSWNDTAWVQDYSTTNSKHSFLCGSVELIVRPGVYTLKYTIDDGSPASPGFTNAVPGFLVDDFAAPAIGTPVYLRDLSGDTLTTASIDGNAPFGRTLRVYVPVGSPGSVASLRYELLTPATKDAGAKVIKTGLGRLLGRVTLSAALPVRNDILFVLRRDSASLPAWGYGALIEMPTNDLGVGAYLLAITAEAAGGRSVTDTARFMLRWVDMPLSMQLPEYAIKALYPIATEDQIDEMLSGGREKQAEALGRFWKPRDPTPGSVYNEAMTEYYRRVDYAYFNFKTLDQPGGERTDRGKIYILYGPPSEVQRDLQPNAPPREVWTYNNRVARTFVFTDESKNGLYRLVEYHDNKKK